VACAILLQVANSYVEGLSAHPFPDLTGQGYEWLLAVQEAAPIIQDEFARVTADSARLQERGNSVWVPAARDDAQSYGPDWRTLVLQDRGNWDKANSGLFPRTKKVFTDLNGE
jgi:hypothetical protein